MEMDREDYISEMEIELSILREGQKTTKQLLKLYKQYIKLLGEELDGVVGLAHIHGWQSTRYEAGVRLRKKIAKLEGIINASYFDSKRYPKWKISTKRGLSLSVLPRWTKNNKGDV